MMPTVEYVAFDTRQARPRYLSERFAHQLGGSVLDVGCDRAVLRDFVGADRYTGIDLSEQADLRVNLQEEGGLPVPDDSYDAVLAADVLEHLDQLHHFFDELVRVAREHVLVTLPNCWNSARTRLERGYGSIAHYGLPPEPPPDRHRWFFSLGEARDFFEAEAARHDLALEELVALEKPRSPLTLQEKRCSQRPWPQSVPPRRASDIGSEISPLSPCTSRTMRLSAPRAAS